MEITFHESWPHAVSALCIAVLAESQVRVRMPRGGGGARRRQHYTSATGCSVGLVMPGPVLLSLGGVLQVRNTLRVDSPQSKREGAGVIVCVIWGRRNRIRSHAWFVDQIAF